MTKGEITHIAVVQVFGAIDYDNDSDTAVRSRAFASLDDAIEWVNNEVYIAHLADTTQRESDGVVYIHSTDGPVWGAILPC